MKSRKSNNQTSYAQKRDKDYSAVPQPAGRKRCRLRITYNAPVCLTFAIICAIALLLNYMTGGSSNALLFCTYRSSLLSPLTYIRLLTHVLGHAGLSHYVSNMTLFMLLGPMLEEKYGSRKLLAVIAAAALMTGIANSLMGTSALLGASGVVFAFVMLASMTSFKNGEIPLTMIVVAVLYIGNEVLSLATADNISQTAHIIGGIAGGACGFILKPKSAEAAR